MPADENTKTLVRNAYTAVADQSRARQTASCCGSSTRSTLDDPGIMADDYSQLAGYVAEADLGLGCGLPTQFAHIRPGDTVIDLGSGAGNDCFVARHETGPTGKVIGIDFTDAMISRARKNADTLGFNNVEFRYGDIEQMPVAEAVADVIVSNCVLNLVPDKAAVFAEMFRVLKPGGHFSISDIVLRGELPASLRQAAELYAGCVSGAIQQADYLRLIADAGFTGLVLQKEKPISLPDDLLVNYLSTDEMVVYHQSDTRIVSITVYAEKPLDARASVLITDTAQLVDLSSSGAAVCTPGGGCC
ncbi:arsenite methyltransferase [Spirosoma rigui]|uniref:arsenite methyltransferase n=1 Tax=Spirosoma rigui TaxID=564064 RepID=UPI0009B044DB|nr:arsenite methyltransferase [Spirosoma rigui]